jgi:hypothetical protein
MNQARKIRNNDGNEVAIVTDSTGTYVSLLGIRFYKLTTAITANVTLTTAPAGSIGKTTSATGRASIFISDGTKWQANA